jgi:hypothetical protein
MSEEQFDGLKESEPPAHLKPVLDAVYDALEKAPRSGLILAVIRTDEDLAFVSNGDPGDIEAILEELLRLMHTKVPRSF